MSSLRTLRHVLILGLATVASLPSAGAQDSAEHVRVRLFGLERPNQVSVAANTADLEVASEGVAIGVLPLGTKATLTVDGASVRLRGGGLNVAGRELRLASDAAGLSFGRINRTYEGRIIATVTSGRLQLVNHVGIEPYVASVVASEYGFPEMEGVKAQAVLARTYVLQRRRPTRSYDVEDHQSSQVYQGRDAATETTRRASAETAGQVLEFRGKLIEALYSSSSGGHTSSNETAWGTAPVAYLRAVPDPFDADAPDHEWDVTASRTRVLAALSRRFGGRVEGINITERSAEGRVLKVQLEGARDTEVSGTEFQSAVNNVLGWRTVRSTNFEVARRGDEYVFAGRGFGHGVGMSQYGARGQARAGRTYEEILGFYFHGTNLAHRGSEEPTLTSAPAILVARSDSPQHRSATEPQIETIRAVRPEDYHPREQAGIVSETRVVAAPAALVASSGAGAASSEPRIVRRTNVAPSLGLPEQGRVAPRRDQGAAYVIRANPTVTPVAVRQAASEPVVVAEVRTRPTPRALSRAESVNRVVAFQEAQELPQRPVRSAW